MTKAGEVSGNLNEILDQLASYLENLDDTRRKVKGAMTYPIFMVIFLGCMVLAMLVWIIPKRAPFFLSELEQFLLLVREQNFIPETLKGSYAGAMGIPQFISSSYRNYAIDFDGDNVVDIWSNPDDVIGSVANYFFQHGWVNEGNVITEVSIKGEEYKNILDEKLQLNIYGSDLKDYGIIVNSNFDDAEKLKLFEFKLEDRSEYWLAQNNFYVITRYNHSKLYAMAVYH